MPSKNTKKKLKESAKSQQPAKVEEVVVETTENAEVETAPAAVEAPKQTNEKVKKSKKVEKKSSKIKKKTKEVFSELKKVNWPTVKQVAKKTATVLAVVAIFAVALLGIHKLLEVIYTLFINSIY